MTRAEHIARHKLLHEHLDELWADWLNIHINPASSEMPRLGDDVTVNELCAWSHQQTIEPELPRGASHSDAEATDAAP